MAIEPVAAPGVAHDVVDRAKPVVGAADRHVEQRVSSITVVVRGADLENALGSNTL
jgi:hypothetical protein